jgi:hypothetical protein
MSKTRENRTVKLVQSLEENQIFVFGSNEAGRHGAGAAKLALGWGAKRGEGIGLHGQTYGIPTKDGSIKTLGLSKIRKYVTEFIEFAQTKPELIFLVTEIGCGLAGYKPKDIAPMFEKSVYLLNIYLPESFWKILER